MNFSSEPLARFVRLALAPATLPVLAVLASTATACGGSDTTEKASPSSTNDDDGGASTSSTGGGTASTSSGAGLSFPLSFGSSSATTGGVPSGSTVTSLSTTLASGSTGSTGEGVHDAGIDTGPVDAGVPQLAAIPLTACNDNSYTMAVNIGSQTFHLSLDTGSSSMGVAGSNCSNCEQDPEYTPGPTATDTNQTVMAYYGSGEWTGTIYKDQVSSGPEPRTPVYFGSMTSQQQFFLPSSCGSPNTGTQGIIGFGPSESLLAGTDSYFTQLTTVYNVDNVFAVELCNSSGTLWLGGYDDTVTTGAVQWTPLLENSFAGAYYSVDFESIIVNGKTIPVATAQFNDSALDTGTGSFLLPTATVNGIAAALDEDAAFQQVFGFGAGDAGAANTTEFLGGGCVQISQTAAELDAMLPGITMVFGKGADAIKVTATATEGYLEPFLGQWCGGIEAVDPSYDGDPLASIIGAPVLRSNIIIFDRTNQRAGFAPHAACD